MKKEEFILAVKEACEWLFEGDSENMKHFKDYWETDEWQKVSRCKGQYRCVGNGREFGW